METGNGNAARFLLQINIKIQLKTMTISILDQKIELKHTLRSHIIYEGITGQTFAPKTITDVITYFYSVVMASAPSLALEFDAFIEWLDNTPNAINDFVNWLTAQQRALANFNTGDTEPKPTTAKVKKKK